MRKRGLVVAREGMEEEGRKDRGKRTPSNCHQRAFDSLDREQGTGEGAERDRWKEVERD